MTDNLQSDPARPASGAKPEPPEELFCLRDGERWFATNGSEYHHIYTNEEAAANTARFLSNRTRPVGVARIGVHPRYRAQVERLRAELRALISVTADALPMRAYGQAESDDIDSEVRQKARERAAMLFEKTFEGLDAARAVLSETEPPNVQ